MHRFHQAINPRLPGRAPLRVMLANDRRAIPENIGYILAGSALSKQFRGERMPKPVRMRPLDARLFEHRSQRPLHHALRRQFIRKAIPKKPLALRRSLPGHRAYIQCLLHIERNWQENRLSRLLRAQENSPSIPIPADPVPRQHRHIAETQSRIPQRQYHRPCPKTLIRRPTDMLTCVYDEGYLPLRKRLNIVRLDVARSLDAPGHILRCPLPVHTEPAELP